MHNARLSPAPVAPDCGISEQGARLRARAPCIADARLAENFSRNPRDPARARRYGLEPF